MCIEFSLGPDYKVRCPVFRVTSKSKGSKTEFIFPEAHEYILLNTSGYLWIYDMVVRLYDVSISSNEKLTGETAIDVLPYMNFMNLNTEMEGSSSSWSYYYLTVL